MVGEAEGTTEDGLIIELAVELLVKLTVGVATVVEVPFASDVVVFRVAGRQHWTSQSFSLVQNWSTVRTRTKIVRGISSGFSIDNALGSIEVVTLVHSVRGDAIGGDATL